MYSCVGIQVERFVCFVFTLEAVMSGEVHSRCSHVLDYDRGGSSWTTSGQVHGSITIPKAMVEYVYDVIDVLC